MTRHVSPRAVLVLVASGVIGFLLGAVFRPLWQDAIEPAQVLAGVVIYPPGNPVYLYSIRTWSLLNQLPAVLISAGVSERVLTWLLSGVLGMLSFQALAMTVLAFSEDLGLAILAPAFIYATQATVGGVTYPIALMGAQATYGVAGLSLMLLAIACAGAKEHKAAAFLLGILPAAHLSVACWTWVVVAIAVAFDAPSQRGHWRAAWRWGAAGLAVSVVSAAVHFARYPPVPLIDASTAAAFRHAIEEYRNVHLQPFAPFSSNTAPAIAGAAFAGAWLWRVRAALPRSSWFLLASLVIAPCVGALMCAWRVFAPSTLPDLAWALMPSRLLNLPILAGMAVIVGIAGRDRRAPASQMLLAFLVVMVSAVAALDRPHLLPVVRVAMLITAVGLLIAAEVAARAGGRAGRLAPAGAWARRLTLVTLVGIAAVLGVNAARDTRAASAALGDRTTDPFLAAIAARPGLLLTASDMHLVPAVTRRPVLVDGTELDGLAYVPEAGPESDRIFREIYGFSLLEPPPATEIDISLWAARTASEWRAIRERFGVTDVLTYADRTLQLPEVARNATWVLYEIR